MSAPLFQRTTFKKRRGTTDKGKRYEDLMAAHFALKFTLQEDVQNFVMSSNDEDFGDFDDVVLDVSYLSGERLKYAIQLKHDQSNKPLMSKDLMVPKGDGGFSFQKYCEDFTKNLRSKDEDLIFVLYTNRSLKSSNVELKLKGKEHFTVKMHEEQQPCAVLATSKNGTQYKCEIIASEETLRGDGAKAEYEQYKEFFKHFCVCTDQSDVNGIEAIMSKTFEGEFGCKDESYSKFVTKWSQSDGKKLFLDKETVKFKLGECLLSTHCSEHIDVPRIDCGPWEMFKETMMQFDVTIIHNVKNGSQRKIVDDLDLMHDDDIEITGRRYGLNSKEAEDKLKILWHLNKVPLIVKVDDSNKKLVLKTVELCKGKKFVLCGGSVTKSDLVGLNVLENMSDLSRVNSNILDNCMVSIQGKQKIGAEGILKHHSVKSLITTNTLMEMLCEYRIGEEQDKLPDYYIKRSLTKTMLDLKCLEKTEGSDLFVITCDKSALQPLVRNKIIDLDDYLSDTAREDNHKMVLVTHHQNVTNEQLEKIAARNPYKVCHHVHLIGSNTLELVTSKDSIKNLKQFRLANQEHTIEEIEILKSKHDVNIVCSAPGMGKSMLMKYLKLNYSSECWVTYIDLKLHYFNFKPNDSCENYLDYIENIGSGKCSELDKRIRRSFRENRKLVLLWDALDEVPAEYVEVIAGAVLKLKGCGLKQWIVSRPHLQTFLEDKFDTFSSNIVELSESQQEEYINRRLPQDKATKLHGEIGRMHSEFLGVPLLLFILTELFLKKKGDWKFASGMARSILYRYFIEEQFQAYYAKTKCSLSNHVMKDILNEYESNRLEKYELMGAVSCFGEEIYKKKTKCRKISKKFESDGVGIIVDVKNNLPVFFHRTFGEYFAARWLTKNYRKVTNFDTLIFREEFRGVRFMMDSILAEDCPAHLAVLHHDLEGLKKSSADICKKDRGGRNVLQILSSWGKTYPVLIVKKLEHEYLVDHAPGIDILSSIDKLWLKKLPCRLEEVPYENLFNFLLKSNLINPFDIDTLFGWNTFYYADAALCLYPFEKLLRKHHKINFNSLKNYSDICTIIYYSVICEYELLFETIESIPQIKFQSGHSLLHLATHFGNSKCLLKILIAEYHDKVNNFCYYFTTPERVQWKLINFNTMGMKFPYQTTDKTNSEMPFGMSPLHIASERGHLEKVRILIKHNAKIDDVNEHYQVTPLQLAVIEGQTEIVEYLIEKNAKTDMENLTGFKLLHFAAYHGHLDVMKFLVSKKICQVNCKARYYDITPLHVAAVNGQTKAIEYLVLNGADVNAKVNCSLTSLLFGTLENRSWRTRSNLGVPEIECLIKERQIQKFGATPLHFASQSGNITAVKFLIEHGCRVTAEDIAKYLPIAYAVKAGRKEIVDYLIRECVKTLHLGGINEQNIFGCTCLHEAIFTSQFEISEFLINSGADIEKAGINGKTPLLFAAGTNSVRILEMLKENGANMLAVDKDNFNVLQIAACHDSIDVFKILKVNNFDLNRKNENEQNLLHLAAANGSYEVAKLLIEDTVFEIDQPDKHGHTPLHFVVDHLTSDRCYFKEEALKLLRLLLDHDANINAGLSDQIATPLQFAVSDDSFCPETIKLLIQNKAELNIWDQNGIFPLLGCTKHANLETVQLLLESGADPYMCDKTGNNCLHYACLMGNTEIAEKLLEYTDPNTANHRGQTPLHLACTRTNLKIVQALMKNGARADIADKEGITATHLLLKTIDKAMMRNNKSTT